MYFLKHTFACVLWFRTFNPLPIVFWQFWGHLRGWSLEEAGGKTAWTCELMGSRFQEPVQKRRSWKAYGFEIVSFDILQRYPHTPYNLHVEFPHFFRRECVETCRPCPRTALERKLCRKKCSCRQGPPADSWGPKSGGSPPIYDIFCMAI